MLIVCYSIAHQPSDLGNASVTAAAITDANYTETSDSANIILGLPVLCSLIAVAIGMNLISFQLGGYTVPNKTGTSSLRFEDQG